MNITEIPLEELFAEIKRRVEFGGPVDTRPVHELDLVLLGELVAGVHGMDAHWLAAESRTRRVASARRQFCAAARITLPGVTFAEIGGVIRRDHGTVIHAVKRHAELLEIDAEYRRTWREVALLITSPTGDASRRRARQGTCPSSPLPA